MKTRAVLIALTLLAAIPNAFATSTADAEAFLKKSVNDVVSIAKSSPDSTALADSLRPLLQKIISFDAMTRRAVGPGWRQFTSEQQKEAIRLFSTLIIRTYSGKFTPGELPEITYKAATSPTLERVEVSTMTLYKGSKYNVIYRLEEIDGWRITDVVIEGVSMVANYRTQFDAEFKQGGADAVLGALKKSVSAP
ncbi:MAG: ABC transporter substrate-binding protein [Verrucomicrobia bacterium]|nr:ABC transporter substrate-binding protein [Verrucomicrobiota bacterium]